MFCSKDLKNGIYSLQFFLYIALKIQAKLLMDVHVDHFLMLIVVDLILISNYSFFSNKITPWLNHGNLVPII